MKLEYKPELTQKDIAANEAKLAQTSTSYTIDEVALHANPDDCYTAIDGRVYDLTAWINKHPGGDENILRLCGIDGSSAFNGKHGDNPQAFSTLTGFQVGILVQ